MNLSSDIKNKLPYPSEYIGVVPEHKVYSRMIRDMERLFFNAEEILGKYHWTVTE